MSITAIKLFLLALTSFFSYFNSYNASHFTGSSYKVKMITSISGTVSYIVYIILLV